MMLMNITPDQKDLQPTQKTQTTTTWQDFVVEELDEEASAAVVGGAGLAKGKNKLITTDPDSGSIM
jgi:hypothetical protein